MNLVRYLPNIVRKHPIVSLVFLVVAGPPVVSYVKQKIDEMKK